MVSKWRALEFVEEAIYLIKKLFITKKTHLEKSVLLFLLYKLYMTDNYVKILKIRVDIEEFAEFKKFIKEIEELSNFNEIKFMFWYLVSKDAFSYVSRSYVLGLDIYTTKTGQQQEENEHTIDSMLFWKDLKITCNQLKNYNIQELKDLDSMHNNAVYCIRKLN